MTPVRATKNLRFLKLHANPYALSTETGRGQKRVTPYAATNYSGTEVVGFSMPTASRENLKNAPTTDVYVSGLLIASWSRLAVISSRRLAFAWSCVSVSSAITASSSSGGGAAGAGADVGAAAGDSATLRRVSYRWVGAGAEASEATGAEAICSSDARKTQPTLGETMRACFPFVAVTSTDVP